jgi:CubicO group peptidase (beta-lactamase class C family)
MSYKQILFFILLAALILCARSIAQVTENKVDEYIEAQMELGRFSGSVLIAKDGEIHLNKGYGMANYELGVSNTPQSKFRIGSVTKQFTSMLIMILQERGELNVNDPVRKFIQQYPNSDKITIHHLLTHTSGIPDLLGIEGFEDIKRDPSTTATTVDFFKNEPLEFEPGSQYEYSNSNYVLLSNIIELITGKSYEDFVEESIFIPLEMNDTGVDSYSKLIKNRADGYFPAAEGIINAPYIDMSIPTGGGGLYSTVEDLYKWDRALYTDKLVNKKSLEKIFTPYAEDYCYGWKEGEEFGHKCYRHGGGIEGFIAVINRFTDDDACIIVLSNFINAPVREISRDLAAMLFGEVYALPVGKETVKVTPGILESYSGIYEIEPGNTLEVSHHDGKLFIAPPGQPPIEIFPETETKFFVKAFNANMSFARDGDGNVSELILHMGKEDVYANKIK